MWCRVVVGVYRRFGGGNALGRSSELNFAKHLRRPVTVAELSNACVVFAHSEAGIVGFQSDTRHGYLVCVFILCLCCHVFR
jgi:hypothetical protein